MKRKDVVKHLTGNKCVLKREGGSHSVYSYLYIMTSPIVKGTALTLLMTTLPFISVAQVFYSGMEPMCWKNKSGKTECYDAPRKWYHLNTLLIDNDSLFLYKVPVQIVKKDTLYSASDGAFFFYYGVVRKRDSGAISTLVMCNCDYCGTMYKIDTATGFRYPLPKLDTLRMEYTGKSIKVGEVVYSPGGGEFFPTRAAFYFDSNAISRYDPKGQYMLIAQGIKNFIQTGELRTDGDTLRISLDRFDDYRRTHLIERLDADLIHIDTIGINFRFYTQQQLHALLAQSNKVVRYIEVGDIVDYWHAARIYLTYNILIPKNLHGFSERQYNNFFEYAKSGKGYRLEGHLPENSWELREQK